MKMTLDLPEELLREVKLRAVHEGKKLKDLTAEILRRGLAAPASTPTISAGRHRVPLPIVPAPPDAPTLCRLQWTNRFGRAGVGTRRGAKTDSAPPINGSESTFALKDTISHANLRDGAGKKLRQAWRRGAMPGEVFLILPPS